MSDRVPAELADRVRESEPPTSPELMLATLTDESFSSADWLFERKLDGERAAFVRVGGEVHLRSRNQRTIDPAYPELVEALDRQGRCPFVADGEIVAFEGPVTSFARLQARIHVRDADQARATGVTVYAYLFDLLWVDGDDVTDLPLRRRKALLRDCVDWHDPLRLTPHRNEQGEDFHREACDKGWEGIMAKRADSAYVGRRTTDWLKFKCVSGQELVIGGYTEPEGERIGLGALLVGYHDDGDLVYAGKVGTGFDDETLRDLRRRLDSRERDTSPFERGDPDGSGVHFVRPDLVCEVGFTEWTDDGRLRHPRYLGLRRDKDAADVVREHPAS